MRWARKKVEEPTPKQEIEECYNNDPPPEASANNLGQSPLVDLMIGHNFLCWNQRRLSHAIVLLGDSVGEVTSRVIGFYKSSRKFAYFIGVMATFYILMSLWHIWNAHAVTQQLINHQQQIERLHQEIEILRGKHAIDPGAQDKA